MVFNQYLRDTRIPTLEYYLDGNTLKYRWTNGVAGFNMPVKVTLNGKEVSLNPKSEWSEFNNSTKIESVVLDPNFYVLNKKIVK
jgi:hypothetical protein